MNILNRFKKKIISGSIMSKICCKCKLDLELNMFGKLKLTKDGLRYYCKNCRKKYARDNK